MIRKFGLCALMAVSALCLSGCVVLLVGGAAVVGGLGTAKWLSDKLVQEVPYDYERTSQAVKNGLKNLQLETVKETITDATTKIDAKYSDGRTVWVIVQHISAKASRLEVRVGVWGGQSDARKVLDSILKNI